MSLIRFQNLYQDLHLPVIVCKNEDNLPIAYMNTSASILFAPSYSTDSLSKNTATMFLRETLQVKSQEEFAVFTNTIANLGYVNNHAGEVITFDGKKLPVSVYSNSITIEKENDYFVLYFIKRSDSEDHANQISAIINASFLTTNVNDSIQTVLSLTGQYINVSRVYIFEEISATTTRNTYEWCADGIEPAIQDLQDLKKEDYNYDVIIESGIYVTDDVRTLPDEDREILEMQNIKSLAIIPFYDNKKALGYVGFDDCENYRVWSHNDIQFLQSISVLLATLIKRRKAEEGVKLSQDILKLITDNSDDIIFVNSLDDYKIKFASRSLASILNTTTDKLIGQTVWEVFDVTKEDAQSIGLLPDISLNADQDRSETVVSEMTNLFNGKTYLTRDNIIHWVDGELVHIQTAIDISARKEYEEQLRYFASTDVMTGIFNREWGSAALEEKINAENAEPGILCFIDVDGLKNTNDTFGHHAGDTLLQKTVSTIQNHLEKEKDFVCRWGGDEFLIWFTETYENADARIKRIQDDLQKINASKEYPFVFSFSYGLIPFTPNTGMTLDSLVTTADELMYKNKVDKRGLNLRRRRDDEFPY